MKKKHNKKKVFLTRTLQDFAIKELKKHYNIGIANKSKEGEFPVFDKIFCNKCKTGYYTYVGIDEPLNSCYHIQIQGIIKVE